MASGGATVDRLRDYLRELKPQARSLLIAELERGLLRGEETTDGSDLVLQELRRLFRESREAAPRYGNSARYLFKPLEPFLVDDAPDHNHPGRIARTALEPLWTWIRRDLLPAETQKFSDGISDALLIDDIPRAELIARAFQDLVAAAIVPALAGEGDARRRAMAQIGTPRAADDARVLMDVLKARDTLAALAARLPGHIPDLSEGRLDNIKNQIDATAARDRDVFPYAILTVMSRLPAFWQLVRLATKAAHSDNAARVAETPYAIAVAVVLAELKRLVGELSGDLKAGGGVAVGALLKVIHDSIRGLRTELELTIESPWGRELAALRGQISNLLKSEIESMPGRVRRLLRPRPSAEIRPNSRLDSTEVAETEALIEFVGTCRYFAGELALNEITQRTYADLQHYLDSGTGALLDALRHAGAADRSFRQSQVDAVARFCGKVFGPDYAAMMSKAAEVAASHDCKASNG